MIKSIDLMKLTQDRAKNPPSDADKDKYCALAKGCGAEYVAISCPYDTSPTMPIPAVDTWRAWINAARKNGLKVWFRGSWNSDEGFNDVPQDLTKNRIADTHNWIVANKEFFAPGDIFTPKPEPQNTGVIGINRNTGDPARFVSVAAFNLWLRDMMTSCRNAFGEIAVTGVKVGYWGFDGFVACGYNNPDHQGRSYLEAATVTAMENIVSVDHYPSLVGKPMTDFLAVFKQALPTAKLVIGENGSASDTGDPVAQFVSDYNACLADPVCLTYNYWQMGPDGKTERLLNSDFSLTLLGQKVKELWASSVPVPPDEPPPPPAVPDIEIGAEVPMPISIKSVVRPLKIKGVEVGLIHLYKKK